MVIIAVLVCLCGGAGAIARFLVDALVPARRLSEFPLGTATLGSYTTFSTWMLETHRPAQDGESGLALANVAVGLIAGLAAVALGRALGGAL